MTTTATKTQIDILQDLNNFTESLKNLAFNILLLVFGPVINIFSKVLYEIIDIFATEYHEIYRYIHRKEIEETRHATWRKAAWVVQEDRKRLSISK